MAIRHASETSVSGACVCFLELCGLESYDLCVDAKAARRIMRHQAKVQQIKSKSPIKVGALICLYKQAGQAALIFFIYKFFL